MIKKARWRVWTPLVISFLGLSAYFGIYAWLSSVEGGEDFLRSFTSSITDAVIIVAPGLVMLALCGEAIRSLLWGDYIAPGHRGVRFRINGRTHFLLWERVRKFRVETPVVGQEGVVGWDYSNDFRSEKRIKSSVATTLDGDFGLGWQGGPDAVCATLEDWRSRHSDPLVFQEEISAAHPDGGQDGTDLPMSLTVRADTRKALGPLLLIWCCFFALFALPIWITAMAAPSGQGLTIWTRLASDWSFWLIALMYVAMALWLGYVAHLLTLRFFLKPTIVLTPAGFTIKDEAGVRFTRWQDVEAFGISYDPNNHREHVGWRYRPGVTTVGAWDKPSLDLDASVGMGWQGSVHDLRTTFDEWLRRYGDR